MYEELKNQMLEEKQTMEKRLKNHSLYGKDHSEDSGELSRIDNHPADEATDLYDREKEMALRAQWEFRLGEIEAALQKMDKGTYGICEKTGEKIPLERLQANPAARTAVFAATHERAHDRPVEEEVLRSDRERDYDYYMDDDATPEDGATGYTESFEGFLSTGMEGFEGTDRIMLHRNKNYKEYKEKLEEEDSR